MYILIMTRYKAFGDINHYKSVQLLVCQKQLAKTRDVMSIGIYISI